MKFYSGFSLKNEAFLFEAFLKSGDYTVSGFSYGSIKALKYAQEEVNKGKRIDTLQLLSPVFFQTQGGKFHRVQMLAYTKDRKKYMQNFIKSCFLPYEQKELEFTKTSKEELEELLEYEWSIPDLLELQSKGVKIEVYLGSKDAIIDVEEARKLFLDVATVTYIKEANHFLQLS
ncbi:pimelyl-ACP methyl ester esterase BioV [Sulfurimonas sp. SAG-AH-194-L11]|nr:pimelyl-ACP methyl ester esterase BioV [Sulfurimonas sp. SAG-AH-194-L11]MDF1877115.1 pimelyl-ACP methyl ester esterase BioV [Sulfurimonas sp. SAG-AH-194-L11]